MDCLEAIGIARFSQKLLRPFRVISKDFLSLVGPLFEGDEVPLQTVSDNSLGCRHSKASKVGLVNGLEVYGHLHGLAHPDVLKGRRMAQVESN